jgi:tRNA-dihydrouridine synthase
MNLSVFLHYSSTQQAAIRVLHNGKVKSAEDIQNRMKNQCYRVLLIQKYRRLNENKKNSKSDWKLFLQTLRKLFSWFDNLNRPRTPHG